MGKWGTGDEDDSEKWINSMSRAAKNICREWYTNNKGKRVRCTRKKGHWGKHK